MEKRENEEYWWKKGKAETNCVENKNGERKERKKKSGNEDVKWVERER